MIFCLVKKSGGGNRPSNCRIREFRDCLNVCNMIDLGFLGTNLRP